MSLALPVAIDYFNWLSRLSLAQSLCRLHPTNLSGFVDQICATATCTVQYVVPYVHYYCESFSETVVNESRSCAGKINGFGNNIVTLVSRYGVKDVNFPVHVLDASSAIVPRLHKKLVIISLSPND